MKVSCYSKGCMMMLGSPCFSRSCKKAGRGYVQIRGGHGMAGLLNYPGVWTGVSKLTIKVPIKDDDGL